MVMHEMAQYMDSTFARALLSGEKFEKPALSVS